MLKDLKLIISLCLLINMITSSASMLKRDDTIFQLGETDFLLKGSPIQLISGEMHYPRIPKEAWRDRMIMARAMGLNTISVYIFWNAHQPEKDKFDFEGNNNIREFMQIAKEEGLFIILRPSPYVCAEWEFGGYPYWLQNEKNLEVRSKNENYLTLYRNYIRKVAEQIADFQINRGTGGNILMIQVENEYGSYGSDKEYLEINKKIFNEAGFDGVLFTCDPIEAIHDGHLDGLLPAINGQDEPNTVKSLIKENNKGKGPFLIAEWYPAWFDSWGRPHNTKDANEYAEKLDAVLKNGISINMYMFHGGTTTGFRNGANYNLYNSGYEPQLTSYDYDAPLNEAGNPTDKFYKFREVIQKYLPKDSVLPDVPDFKPTIEINNFSFNKKINLFDNLNSFEKFVNKNTLTYEEINLDYGYVVYKTNFSMTADEANNKMKLEFDAVRDYAVVYINRQRVGVLDRRSNSDKFILDLKEFYLQVGDYVLEILVENMGRINFGPEILNNKKGLLGNVKLNERILENWTTYKISLDKLRDLEQQNLNLFMLGEEEDNVNEEETPMLIKGNFNLTEVGDSYLDLTNWHKGTVWINERNLGRYWDVGPQQSLYIPREWLNLGNNEIVIFEAFNPDLVNLRGIKQPILDKLRK